GSVAALLWWLDGAEVQDVDDQQVSWLRPLDLDRPAQHVADAQVHVAHVVGRVVVAQLRVGPLAALDAELAAGRNGCGGRDVGVPAVVAGHRLVAHRLRLVDAEHNLGHGGSLNPEQTSRSTRGLRRSKNPGKPTGAQPT